MEGIQLPETLPGDLDDLPEEAKQIMRAGRDARFQMVVDCDELPSTVRAYLACIRHADALVGHLLDTLENTRYAGKTGGEELYDRSSDVHEWYNLADEPRHTNVKRRLATWLPERQGITLLPPDTP